MNKLLTKIVGAALGLSMTVGVGVAVATSQNGVAKAEAGVLSDWQAVTGSLTAGNEYLIVKVGGGKCMQPAGTNVNTGDYSQVNFTAQSAPDNGFVFADAGDGKFYIKDGARFVYASGTTNNGLGNRANNDSNASWAVWTVAETQTAGQYTIINGNSRQLSAYSTTNWRSYGTDSGSKTNVLIYEKASSGSLKGTVEITNPIGENLYLGDTGNLTYSWTPHPDAPSVTIKSTTWTSSDGTVVEVNNSTNKYSVLKKGSVTLTLTAVDTTDEEYVVSTAAIQVINQPLVLPDMPNGDYVKVTSAQEDYTGYYLIVYETSSKAWDGTLSDLDSTPNTFDVTISDGIIESNSSDKTNSLNQHAFYIDKIGSSYRIAANITTDKLRYIGRTSNSNGLNQAQSDNYENEVGFANSAMYVKASTVARYIGFNAAADQQKFRFLGSANAAFYKKTAAVDTLRSIEIVSPTTSLKDGQKFVFGGSVTATYSITGTTGHTGITSGLSFFIGGSPVDANTTMTRGVYEVTVSYNDGTTTKTSTYTLTVGYADATSVVIDGPSSISVAKGWTGTFSATVNPSNAENVVVWSVTDEAGDPTALATIVSNTGAFTAGNTAGTVRAVATSKDGNASSYVTVTITGDPLIELDKSSINAYSIDNPVSLTATPKNFPEGTKSYSWASNNTDVATVSNVASATNSVSFVGGGTATITVTGYVDGVQKAQTTCLVTVTKTRSVTEAALLTASYDFSGIKETGTRINTTTVENLNGYYVADEVYPLDEPTLALPDYDESSTNYVYLGNGSGGAHQSQGGFVKFGKSNYGGSISFTFTHNITKVVVLAQKWLSSSTEGTIYINGTAPEANAGTSDYAEVVLEGLSAKTITISTPNASARAFVKSITFYSQQSSTEIGRTSDVVGLETFIEEKLHWNTYHNDHIEGDNTGTGDCVGYYDKDGNTGAKYAFNHLNAHQRKLFTTHSAYAAEWKRLQDWAKANGDSLDETNLLAAASNNPTVMNSSNNAAAIIAIVSVISLSAVAGFFLLRKRKEQ